MNGIKALSGKTGNLKLVRFITVLYIFSGCVGKSSNKCEWEKINYSEKWNFEVALTYRYSKYKATYVIQTISGKKIFFRPTQDIVSWAEKGDRIFKEKNSQYAYLITNEGDSLKSRIFSTGCDDLVGVGATSK